MVRYVLIRTMKFLLGVRWVRGAKGAFLNIFPNCSLYLQFMACHELGLGRLLDKWQMLSFPNGEEKVSKGDWLMDWKRKTKTVWMIIIKSYIYIHTVPLLNSTSLMANTSPSPLMLWAGTAEDPGWTPQQVETKFRSWIPELDSGRCKVGSRAARIVSS